MDAAVSEPLEPQLLAGRTALVTGAGAGVGRGVALALAGAGANVVIAARRRVTGAETAALIVAAGGRALSLEVDVSDRGQVIRAVDGSVAHFGGLEIVIHNASSGLAGKPAKLDEITDAMWNEQCGVGLDATYYLAHAALPYLRDHGRGRFLVMSSSQGLHGGAMNPAYPAVKNAMRGLVKALAREWGRHGILVNAVAPAALTDAAAAYFERNPEMQAKIVRSIPLGRLGDSRTDIGAAVVAMCSDHWRYVTGLTIPVDGGNYSAL
jgi:NAD(P)-dependent dehydrogenase (short-subunit alcohol dehydrogenase family)